MYRFFIEKEAIDGERIRITGPDVNHIKNVLRMQIGEQILISDKASVEYTCAIEKFAEDAVYFKILDMQRSAIELPAKICLFQGLPKSDKMELIIQKAVELGVHRIVPVETSRSVVKLDEKKRDAKRKRWQLIAEGAAKQSKRMIIPEVGEVVSFSEALKKAASMELRVIPYELADDMAHTRAVFSGIRPGSRVAVFIGPEGGFTDREVTLAKEAGVVPVTLGRRILRTETAGICVLSILMYLLEE